MAYSPSEKYPGAVDSDPNYKGGKFRDNNPSTTNNGSPLKAIDRNELLARDEAIMNDAGFDYNGLPDTPQDSQLFKAYKASLGNGANLLSNHNFLIPSPDDSQPAPSATPTSYPPGYQIFSGVFANETSGISNLTYIDGRVSFSGGDLYFAVPNTGGLERLNADQFVASVADFDGKPRTRGVSFSLVGDEYRVTVGIDALSDGVYDTPLGSVKFEKGKVATGHEVQSAKGQTYTYPTVLVAVSSRPPIGAKVAWEGYYERSDGGSNWGIVKKGAHTEDGGSIFSIDSNTYIEANLTNPILSKKFGVKFDFNPSTLSGTDNTDRLQALIDYSPDIKMSRGGAKSKTLLVPQGFSIKGLGSRHQKSYASAIYAELDDGRDLFEYQGSGYPDGDVLLSDILLVNIKGILPGGDLFNPTEYQEIIDSNNRAFWGVNTQPFDTVGWVQKKEGGANVPVLRVKNVQCLNFFCAVDCHSWMTEISNLRSRNCGIMLRHYGTSLSAKSCWPEFPLLGCYELQSNYSHMRSCSLVESKVDGFSQDVIAVKLSGGSVTLDSCGFEGNCKELIQVNNGRHNVGNLQGYVADANRGKPDYVFTKIGRGILNIEESFDFRWFNNAFMKVASLNLIDGISFTTPLQPHAFSYANLDEVSWPQEPIYAYREVSGEFEGIFGTAPTVENGATLIPYDPTSNNYVIDTGVTQVKVDWAFKNSINMSKAAARFLTCTVSTNFYTAGDRVTIDFKFVPSIGFNSANPSGVTFPNGIENINAGHVLTDTVGVDVGYVADSNYSISVSHGNDIDDFFKASVSPGASGWGSSQREASAGMWEIRARGVLPYNVDKDRRFLIKTEYS